MNDLVTIAIPTYRPYHIQEALESARRQTYQNVEILISLNPSTSEATETNRRYCLSAQAEDTRIHFHENRQNIGAGRNWNSLIDRAQGRFITFLADDDRLLPNFVAKLLLAMRSDTVLAFCDHHLIDAHGQRLPERTTQFNAEFRGQMPPGLLEEPAKWAWQESMPIVASLFSTDAVRKVRFSLEHNAMDLEMFLWIALLGRPVVYVRELLSEYRVHPHSTTNLDGNDTDKAILPLAAIPASREVEPFKRRLLHRFSVSGVGRALLKGDLPQARAIQRCPYYRGLTPLSMLAQRLCLLLPSMGACGLYRTLHRLRPAGAESAA